MIHLMNIGYLLSLSLIVLTSIFFVLGVYLSTRYYRQLSYTRDRGRVFLYLSMLCFVFSIFSLLTFTDGFSWETLIFSVAWAGILILLIMFGAFVRRKTAVYLKKGDKVKTFLNLILDGCRKMHTEKGGKNTQHEE